MRSIYERVLGSDFVRLHPEIQRRFGFSSKDNIAAMGSGVMEEVWHGPAYTLPFLYLGSWRSIMFPERGKIFDLKLRITAMSTRWAAKRSHGFAHFTPSVPGVLMHT